MNATVELIPGLMFGIELFSDEMFGDTGVIIDLGIFRIVVYTNV